jgi:hypothetical protein
MAIRFVTVSDYSEYEMHQTNVYLCGILNKITK